LLDRLRVGANDDRCRREHDRERRRNAGKRADRHLLCAPNRHAQIDVGDGRVLASREPHGSAHVRPKNPRFDIGV